MPSVNHGRWIWGLALLVATPTIVAAQPAKQSLSKRSDAVAVKDLAVYPASVSLAGKRATRQLVVSGTVGGGARDFTATAVYTSSNPKVVVVERGKLRAIGDGKAMVRARIGNRSVLVPVEVHGTAAANPISFKFETLPLLTKQGCSGGSCHGSPHGKGGFALSLFGYDPQSDRISLTRDGFTRRLNLLEPAESLLLKKPLLELSHGGGRKLKRSEGAYGVLKTWIAEGAGVTLPKVECESIEVYPGPERLLNGSGDTQQLSVLARFSDGSTRDVTALATYDSSAPAVVQANHEGRVLGGERGQAAISVRYLDQLESVHFTVIHNVPGFRWTNPPEANFVDRLVNTKLRQLQYLPSGSCTDAEFIRRVTLDLTGLLPTADRARRFAAECAAPQGRSQARAALVEELLASEEYARFWALKKADLMRVSPKRLPEGRAESFSEWLVRSTRENMPYDRFARELLTATGDTKQAAAANYFLAIPTAEERTEMSAQLLMGSRLECARCHNHPFENWTMRDYYSLSAVFARTANDKGVIKLLPTGEAHLPTTGEVMRPWGASPGSDGSGDRRAAFAEWLTRRGNPLFARVEANRIWAELMGRGIVAPVDDFRSSNPPANGPLLDALAAEFERSGFDRKHLIRLICNSQTYQRSSTPNASNKNEETLFSHARVRLLSAEQMQDAVGRAARSLPDLTTPESRASYATQRAYSDGSSFVAAFGQPARETACTCERQTSPTLLQALELLNGGIAQRAAAAGAAYYAKFGDEALIEELYLASLSRRPTPKEREAALGYLRQGDRLEATGDLVWTVLNTQEFLFQH